MLLKRMAVYSDSLRNRYFIALSVVLLLLIFLAYSNHFTNSFQFDDYHTIEINKSITKLDPVLFFSDATTFSALPSNQSYRPYTTLENAIDYAIGGGLDPKIFHVHIFISFLGVLFVLFFFIKKLLDSIDFSKANPFWALLVTSIFGLLCVNAETVNYIIQRAEITAAFYVLAGITLFLAGGTWRKYHVYLIFPFIGFFAKEMTFVFAPLLLLYLLLFEEQVYLLHFYKASVFQKCLKSFRKALPAFILTIAFYVFYSKMRPETFFPGGPSQFLYLITQPMVICHYVLTYFIPYNLSADTDWQVFTSLTDYRAIIGIILTALLLYVALLASKKEATRLFSFGLLWFFISLLPTSSFIPFAEVMNDHRTFIPYIGLTIAFVFGGKFALKKIFKEKLKSGTVRIALGLALVLFLGANVYGIRERNKVWKDDVTLWLDVTEKSPNNGRGLMNYGLALMEKGDYQQAGLYFNRALKIVPNYDVLHVNIAILNNSLDNKTLAEEYFLKAIELNPNNHSNFFFYGRFLADHQRNEEAIAYLEKTIELSPNYALADNLLMDLYYREEHWEDLKKLSQQILVALPENANALRYLELAKAKKSQLMVLEEDVEINPSPEKYLDLSLRYFQLKRFEESIRSANQALDLKEDYPEAFNNIGISYFELTDYDRAIAAYDKAIALDTSFQLAKNNRINSVNAKTNRDVLASKFPLLRTAEDFLNFSLECYQLNMFHECVESAKKSIAIKPSANAFNNLCAAYNQLGVYEKAIDACRKALEIDKDHRLAQGNLDFAVSKTNLP